MSDGNAQFATRRSLLAATVGAVVAWVAAAAGRVPAVRAGVDGDVVLGANNVAAGVTTVQNASSDALVGRGGSAAHSGVWGDNTSGGYGVSGSTSSATTAGVWGSNAGTGIGVRGTAAAGGIGVRGAVDSGTGVVGVATSGIGVRGDSQTTDAILGTSNAGAHSGVWGNNTGGGYGVSGSTNGAAVVVAGVWGSNGGAGAGVRGSSATGAGVRAESVSGHALEVVGKAHFSRSGKVTIAAGKKSIKVTLAGVTSSSMVFANLAKNVSGRSVAAVVPASGSFTIYGNANLVASAAVAWFVLDA